MSDNRMKTAFRRWTRDEEGAALTEFGLILPVLMILIAVLLEFIFMSAAYIQVGEAARRGSRQAVIVEQVADISALTEESDAVVCKNTGGTVTCTGTTVDNAAAFDSIYDAMHEMLPTLKVQQIRIEYRHGGIGDPDALNGVIPMITVRIVNYHHEFILSSLIPGAPSSIQLPSVSVTFMGSGKAVSSS